jgi:hypothetical protein
MVWSIATRVQRWSMQVSGAPKHDRGLGSLFCARKNISRVERHDTSGRRPSSVVLRVSLPGATYHWDAAILSTAIVYRHTELGVFSLLDWFFTCSGANLRPDGLVWSIILAWANGFGCSA